MRTAAFVFVGAMLGLIAAWLTGCTVTLSATEKGAAIGVTLDPVSTIRALADDEDERRHRP